MTKKHQKPHSKTDISSDLMQKLLLEANGQELFGS